MTKGETVFYCSCGEVVRGRVSVAHRDGSARVEAQFFRAEGRDYGPYIGNTYEIAEVFPNEMSAQAAAQRREAQLRGAVALALGV